MGIAGGVGGILWLGMGAPRSQRSLGSGQRTGWYNLGGRRRVDMQVLTYVKLLYVPQRKGGPKSAKGAP